LTASSVVISMPSVMSETDFIFSLFVCQKLV